MPNKNWEHHGVRAVNQYGPVAVAVGDPLYYHEDKAPVLNCDSTGTLVGHSLEEMAPQEGRVIKVKPLEPEVPEEPVQEDEKPKGKNNGKSV